MEDLHFIKGHSTRLTMDGGFRATGETKWINCPVLFYMPDLENFSVINFCLGNAVEIDASFLKEKW